MQANVRRNTRYIIILKQIQKKKIFEIGFIDSNCIPVSYCHYKISQRIRPDNQPNTPL